MSVGLVSTAVGVEDDSSWAERNAHWLARSARAKSPRPKRERARNPLVLCGHGVSLCVEAGTLLIRNGFTHHPQERETFRFFKGDLNLPPKIIMLDGSGSLSFDVVNWLAVQGVALFRIDYLGEVVSVIGGSGSPYDSDRVRWQVETRADPARRLEFCCDLIAEKIRATVHTMKTALPDTPMRAKALDKAARSIDRLERRAVRSVSDVLLVEAGAAAAYFAAWRGLPLRWPRRSRAPIPQAWQFAEGRGAIRDRRGLTNRHATHPVNAMLNYAYAVLHSQVQLEAVSEGYDPRLGIMHESRSDAQALVLDFMEVRRPAVDAAVLKFVSVEMFSGADFVIRDNGVCRLAPQLARRLTTVVAPSTVRGPVNAHSC
jgi:CRISPR-associated endonuclease Cas1